MTKALMPKLLVLTAAVLLMAVTTSLQPVHGEDAKPAIGVPAAGGPAKTYVLLVGISKYDDKQIKPRPKAEADAKALYELFTDKKYTDIDPKNVRLLLGDPGEDKKALKASRANFLDALKAITKEAQPNDTVLIGFIGQGAPLGESGDRRCYLMSDSSFKNRDKDAVATEEIEEALKKLQSKKLAVFLDVDFKGMTDDAAKGLAEPSLGKSPYREFLGDDGSEDHLQIPGRVAFLATNGLTTSLDLKDNGIFTTVLLEAFKGKADSEGYEPDSLVTVDEVARYMNKRLPELAKANGKTEKEKEQDHFVISGPGTHFVLTTNPDAVGAVKQRLEKFDSLVKDGKLQDKALIEEGRTLLTRMPLLKARQSLRKAYQQFADGKTDLAKLKEERDGILASMKLKVKEAQDFAMKVLEATELIKEDYVRDVNQGQMVNWAIRELYNFVEEKVPDNIDAELKKVSTMRLFQLRNLLMEARSHLGKREDLDNLKDLTVALQRMLGKLDPHTTYIDPETKKKMEDELRGNFTGIGIQIRKDAATDQLLVVTPIKGSPAYRAKLQAGDVITKIIREVDSDGNPLKPTEVIETKGMALNKAVKLILGQEGTKVKLLVKREGVEKPFEVEITRGRVTLETILGAYRKQSDDWEFMIDPKFKIGYIRLTSFARPTYRDLELAMKQLQAQGVKGIILDLRFNPGGLLDSAIKVSDLFVDDGLIVSIRPRGGQLRETRFNGRHAGSLMDFPMVCLINGYSASGSEIVSAALQDHNRAIIIGERSYGKGSVQNIKDFEVTDPKTNKIEKADIKLTTATFWRPNGKNLNKASTAGKEDEEWGVIPDKIIKLSPKERRDLAEHQRNLETIEPPGKKEKAKEFKDRQLDAALEYLRGQIKIVGRGNAGKAG